MIIHSVTQDFIQSFDSEEDYRGDYGQMVSILGLPDGVDDTNEEVIRIVQKCKNIHYH